MSREFSLKQKKKEDLIKLVLDLENKLDSKKDEVDIKKFQLINTERVTLRKALENACYDKAVSFCPNKNWDEVSQEFQKEYINKATKELDNEEINWGVNLQTPKIKITREQLKLINDVFNYALNFIDQTTETSILIKQGQDGQFSELKYEDFEEDVTELASMLEKHFEVESVGDSK